MARTATLEPKVVDVHDAAAAYGISARTLKALINSGELRGKRESKKANARYLVRVADLDAYVDTLPDA